MSVSFRKMSGIDQIEVSGSHYEVGMAIGQRFARQIQQALERYTFLRRQLLPYHRSREGQARYRELLRLNRARFPDYLAELEGLARGSGRPFEELFLVNTRGEYAGYLRGPSRGCSDCALLTDRAALVGHNEDGSPVFDGLLSIVRAQIDDKPTFTALSYPGFLCGHTFGFNAQGICFSVDTVQPRAIRLGAGRHFLARSLLEVSSLDEAVERVTVPGRASGFSYTIGSLHERRIVHIEVAPEIHHVHQVRGAYFHANHYLHLDGVEQIITASSQARVERAHEILQEPPRDADGVLSLLGDRANQQYPIYRDAAPPDTDQTFCTVLFDLDARRLRIYTSDMSKAPHELVEFDLT